MSSELDFSDTLLQRRTPYLCPNQFAAKPRCAKSKIYTETQVIKANEANEAWEKVVNKEARYRYVIDGATI